MNSLKEFPPDDRKNVLRNIRIYLNSSNGARNRSMKCHMNSRRASLLNPVCQVLTDRKSEAKESFFSLLFCFSMFYIMHLRLTGVNAKSVISSKFLCVSRFMWNVRTYVCMWWASVCLCIRHNAFTIRVSKIHSRVLRVNRKFVFSGSEHAKSTRVNHNREQNEFIAARTGSGARFAFDDCLSDQMTPKFSP